MPSEIDNKEMLLRGKRHEKKSIKRQQREAGYKVQGKLNVIDSCQIYKSIKDIGIKRGTPVL